MKKQIAVRTLAFSCMVALGAAVALFHASSEAATPGVLGYWSLDTADISGTSALDRSGSGYNLTINGTKTAVTGKYGQALDMVPSTGSALVTSSIPNAFRNNNNSFALWFRPQSLALENNFHFYMWTQNGAHTVTDALYSDYNHIIRLSQEGMTFGTAAAPIWVTGVDIDNYPLNQWMHLALVQDATAKTFTLYINGSVAASTTYNGTIDTSLRNTIQITDGINATADVVGVDEVYLFSKALTATEVTQVYNDTYSLGGAQTPPPTPPPPPSIAMSANPVAVNSGGSSAITWTASQAQSCTASGGWTGLKSTSGTQTVTNIQLQPVTSNPSSYYTFDTLNMSPTQALDSTSGGRHATLSGAICSPAWQANAGWNLPSKTGYIDPAFADLDNDGDLDLMLGNNDGTLHAFQNTGTRTAPIWTAKSTWSITNSSFREASPSLGDLDNDGDFDLLVGSIINNTVYAYKNTGTLTAPVWTAQTSWNLTGRTEPMPTLGDLDNDGDLDLLVGDWDGFSYAYKNTGTVTAPVWTATSSWNVPDAGQAASPELVDLNNDGLLDVMVGEYNRIAKAYKNTGTISSPVWTFTTTWNSPNAGTDEISVGTGDIDGDNDPDLFIGRFDGSTLAYQNTGTCGAGAGGLATITGKMGQALDFDGINDVAIVGNAAMQTKTIAFWMKADDRTSRYLVNLSSTANISINASSQIVTTGFTSPTIMVDGVVGNLIADSNWHHVTVSTATAVDTTNLEIGRVGIGYFDGALDEFRLYGTALTTAEGKYLYDLGMGMVSANQGGNEFTLTCLGNDGTSVSRTLTVAVDTLPELSLSAAPLELATGNTATLSWSGKSITDCTAAGGWSGTKAISGSFVTPALTATTTFNLNCKTLPVPDLQGFESATFPPSGWTTGGNTPWFRDTATGMYAGTASASSGVIGNNAESWLDFNHVFQGDGSISFYWKVGSEPGNDNLLFCFDNDSCTNFSGYDQKISGVKAWVQVTKTVPAGAHSFRWKYQKDSAMTANGDKASVDNIVITDAGASQPVPRSVEVKVLPPLSMTFTGDKASVATGESLTLNWTTINAQSCTASNGWTGTRTTSGSQVVTNITANKTFVLSCLGTDGTTQSKSVNVTFIPRPTLSFSADQTTVPANGSVTVTWNATDSTSCTASGGWTGVKSSSGTQTLTGINKDTVLNLTCTGNDTTTVSSSISIISSDPANAAPFIYWPFDTETIVGTVAKDVSGNGKDLSLFNLDPTAGYQNEALYFDGSGDYASQSIAGLSTGDFTYALWALRTGTLDIFPLVLPTDTGGNAVGINVNANNTVDFFVNDSSYTSLETIPTDRWVHLAIKREGGSFQGYINGIPTSRVGTNATPLNLGTCPIFIGVDDDSTDCSGTVRNQYWNGAIDEIKIYNRALSHREIAELVRGYQANGKIIREVWNGISNALTGLLADADFPLKPDLRQLIAGLDAPRNQADSFGSRMLGYVIPPQTGAYTFYVASDFQGDLFLSTDASASAKTRIAFNTAATSPLEWNREASQKSASISLSAGKQYYIEAVHGETTGADHVTVAWSGPGISGPVTIPPFYLTNQEFHWLEAEYNQGQTGAFVTENDLLASNHHFVQTPSTAPGYASPPPQTGQGVLTYTVNVAMPGDYVLWGRVKAATTTNDSFYVQVDSGPVLLWEFPASGTWAWDKVSHLGGADPVIFPLSSGTHTIRFFHRESGAQLDKLLLTNDLNFQPSGKGAVAENFGAPTLEMSATATTIKQGQTTTINWSTSGAAFCQASDGWTLGKSTYGSKRTAALTADTLFTLTCTGYDGVTKVSKSVAITVLPPPTLTLAADPTAVFINGSTTLTWDSTNTSACTASGGWSGPALKSGTQVVNNLTATTTFTLTCTGVDASQIKRDVTVTVTPRPTLTFTADQTTLYTGGSTTLRWEAQHAQSCTASGTGWFGPKVLSGTQSVVSITANTDYKLSCLGLDGTSVEKEIILTFVPRPKLTMTIDKATVATNGSVTLGWSTTDAASCTASGDWTGTQPLSGTKTISNITSAKSFTLTCTGTDGTTVSDTKTVALIPQPTVKLTTTSLWVASDGSVTLSWQTTNTQSCTASGGTFIGSKATNSTELIPGIKATTTYRITCLGIDGSTKFDEQTVTVRPPATVNLSSDKLEVPKNGTVVLTWTTTNATSCVASGDWTSTKAVNGTETITGINADKTFTLTCTGVDERTVNKSVTVKLLPPPTLNLSADRTTIKYNESALISWTATNVSSCVATGKWTGTLTATGTYNTGPLQATEDFILTCQGVDGTPIPKTIKINVMPQPTLDFSAASTEVLYGQATTLTWTTKDVSSCTASDGWSGVKPVSGTVGTGNLTTSTKFTLTCTGTDGSSIMKAVNITVIIPPPLISNFSASVNPIKEGESAVLTWSAANVSSCTAADGWTGTKTAIGTETIGPLTADTTFTLRCTGIAGTPIEKSIVVAVKLKPVIEFSATPAKVKVGGTAQLTWNATNVSSCTAKDAWSGVKPLNGSEATGMIKAATVYTLECLGTDGSTASKSVTITMDQALITIFPGICHFYTDEGSFPQTDSYAPSYNILSEAKELLMKVACADDGITSYFGNGSRNLYIYESGYLYSDSAWQPVNYTGSNRVADTWYSGSATLENYPMTKEQLIQRSLMLSYFCQWDGFEWKCGCKDATCSDSLWSLQAFQADHRID